MKKFVPDFIKAKRDVLRYFKCEDDYLIKPATSASWHIKELDDMYFINYNNDGEVPGESIIVKKDGEPLIFEQGDYTLVICVECVKLGIIFKNENKI